MAAKRLGAELAKQKLRAQIMLEEAVGLEVGSLSMLLHDMVAQTAALSMHAEEVGEAEEEKKEEEDVDEWFSEED
jgi:hypothetical protein